MTITAEQVSKARWLLGLTLRDLGVMSNLSHGTIRNFESGKHRPSPYNVMVIRRTLEVAGVEFIDGESPSARLRKPE